MGGKYVLVGSNLEKREKFFENYCIGGYGRIGV